MPKPYNRATLIGGNVVHAVMFNHATTMCGAFDRNAVNIIEGGKDGRPVNCDACTKAILNQRRTSDTAPASALKYTYDRMLTAVVKVKEVFGVQTAKQLMLDVCKANRIANVPEDQFENVTKAAEAKLIEFAPPPLKPEVPAAPPLAPEVKPAPKTAPEVPVAPMTPAQIIDALIAIALAAFTALDDSEERMAGDGSGEKEYVINSYDFATLEANMAVLDNLPEKPNTLMTGPLRAAWALRSSHVTPAWALDAEPPVSNPPTCDDALRALLRQTQRTTGNTDLWIVRQFLERLTTMGAPDTIIGSDERGYVLDGAHQYGFVNLDDNADLYAVHGNDLIRYVLAQREAAKPALKPEAPVTPNQVISALIAIARTAHNLIAGADLNKLTLNAGSLVAVSESVAALDVLPGDGDGVSRAASALQSFLAGGDPATMFEGVHYKSILDSLPPHLAEGIRSSYSSGHVTIAPTAEQKAELTEALRHHESQPLMAGEFAQVLRPEISEDEAKVMEAFDFGQFSFDMLSSKSTIPARGLAEPIRQALCRVLEKRYAELYGPAGRVDADGSDIDEAFELAQPRTNPFPKPGFSITITNHWPDATAALAEAFKSAPIKPARPIYTISTTVTDPAGNAGTHGSRSSTTPDLDLHIMEAALEYEQAKRLRNVTIPPRKIGQLWMMTNSPLPYQVREIGGDWEDADEGQYLRAAMSPQHQTQLNPAALKDWMRELVFRDMTERLALPEGDEARIGADETLHELNLAAMRGSDARPGDVLKTVRGTAEAMVSWARRNGVVVTVEQKSSMPLAMGNYESVVSVRLARGAQ